MGVKGRAQDQVGAAPEEEHSFSHAKDPCLKIQGNELGLASSCNLGETPRRPRLHFSSALIHVCPRHVPGLLPASVSPSAKQDTTCQHLGKAWGSSLPRGDF